MTGGFPLQGSIMRWEFPCHDVIMWKRDVHYHSFLPAKHEHTYTWFPALFTQVSLKRVSIMRFEKYHFILPKKWMISYKANNWLQHCNIENGLNISQPISCRMFFLIKHTNIFAFHIISRYRKLRVIKIAPNENKDNHIANSQYPVWRKVAGHQQSYHWLILPGIFRSQNQKGW